jgi:hypothetical protein
MCTKSVIKRCLRKIGHHCVSQALFARAHSSAIFSAFDLRVNGIALASLTYV